MDGDEADVAERLYRQAVERQWDPASVDLDADRDPLESLSRRAFTQFRATVATFGAGEEAVTEDLAPLAIVVDAVPDQRFLASHQFDEARHARFFERYWSAVVNPVERARGLEASDPTEDRWFGEAYETLFDRTETATHRLLEADTPANRARAYAHYHLTIEGMLAQAGFRLVGQTFDDGPGPELPGLVEGFARIREDEGRHVGYGMHRLQALTDADAVSWSVVEQVLAELADPLETQARAMGWSDLPGPDGKELAAFVRSERERRLDQLKSGSIPGLDPGSDEDETGG
jgi:ribonucleoside-diphosphate reductase beta chain